MSELVRVAYGGPSASMEMADEEGNSVVIAAGSQALVQRHIAESAVRSMPDHRLEIVEEHPVTEEPAAPAAKRKGETGSVAGESRDPLTESALTPTE